MRFGESLFDVDWKTAHYPDDTEGRRGLNDVTDEIDNAELSVLHLAFVQRTTMISLVRVHRVSHRAFHCEI